jgi:hypothetical protein
VLDVGARYAQHDLGLWFVQRYLDAELLADRQQLVAIRFGARLGLAGELLVRRLLVELRGRKAGFEHRMARLLDQRGHIDAHRTDQAAAAAHVAAVEQQVLPLRQLISGDFALQPQQPEQRGEGARFALVGLLEGLDLPDRGVLRILGGDIEMTGIRADAAVDAGFEPKGAQRAGLARKAAHRAGDLGLVAALLRRRKIGADTDRGAAHEVAPLRARIAPLMARDGKI